MSKPLTTQEQAQLDVILAMVDVIKTSKSIPSGHLYAAVMSKVSLNAYHQIIGMLKRAGIVTEEFDVLTYVAKV